MKMKDVDEKPDSWWRKIYILVVLFTAIVIVSLGLFSLYFSP